MDKNKEKHNGRLKKHRRVRKKVVGTPECPRMSVFRSARNISCQLIDDDAGTTLMGLSTMDKTLREQLKNGGNKQAAEVLGKEIAVRAKEKGVTKVVFDRGGFKFHGRVKALAEAARKAGLKF